MFIISVGAAIVLLSLDIKKPDVLLYFSCIFFNIILPAIWDLQDGLSSSHFPVKIL